VKSATDQGTKLTRLNDLPPTKRAITHAGGPTELAKVLGVTPQAVSRWSAANQIPAKWVLPLEALIEGAVKRHELRPDLYPAPDLDVNGSVDPVWLKEHGYDFIAPIKKKKS